MMRILLAIDGSENAFHAAEFFCRLPHRPEFDVEVVSVINLPDFSTSVSTEAWKPEYIERMNAAADQAYARVCEYFEGSNARLSHHKASGHVGSAIVDRAADTAADLIVIGATGHSAIARVLLGSVSDFVANHAKCSVLVVRPPDNRHTTDDSLRVTIAYDGSAQSQRALAQFQLFSWVGAVRVQLLTVVQSIQRIPFEVPQSMVQQIAAEQQDAERESEKIVAQLQSQHVNATATVVAANHVGTAVVEAAQKHHSDVIVLGNTGLSLIPRLLLGSVSSQVLRHAKQSVWIVR
jgi:nucleotide-binding universal stress UspA family protein